MADHDPAHGGPAFPQGMDKHYAGGQSLRDYYAGQVLEGLAAAGKIKKADDYADAADLCWGMAAFMISRRPA